MPATKSKVKATNNPAPRMVDLVSRSAKLWISLETNVDDYNQMGGMRKVATGTRIRFRGGKARVPAEWKDAIEATRGYGRDFWYAEDPRRVIAAGLRQVVSGMATSRIPQAGDIAPIEGWDEMGARAIRTALEQGEIDDVRVALAWETRANGGKSRVQVIDALGKALRQGSDEAEQEEQEEAGGLEGPDVSDEDTLDGDGEADDAEDEDEDGGL